MVAVVDADDGTEVVIGVDAENGIEAVVTLVDEDGLVVHLAAAAVQLHSHNADVEEGDPDRTPADVVVDHVGNAVQAAQHRERFRRWHALR